MSSEDIQEEALDGLHAPLGAILPAPAPIRDEHPSIDLAFLREEHRNGRLLKTQVDTIALHNVLKECEEDIKLLQDELSQITARLAQKYAQRDACREILSPIMWIPDDILELIFLECLDTSRPPDPRCAPLQLAAVSRRWRAIACSTPALWTNFKHHSNGHFPLNLAKLWISRTPRLSLSLANLANDAVRNSQFRELIEYIKYSQVQLQKLDMFADIGGKDYVTSLGEYAQVEELVIRLFWPGDLSDMTNVKRLYSFMMPPTLDLSPPSEKLTTIFITTTMHLELFRVIMYHCENLHQLSISVAASGIRPTYHEDSLYGSSLTRPALVYLGIHDGDTDVDILNGFSFPSLRVLEYAVCTDQVMDTTWLASHPALKTIRRLTLQFQSNLPEETLFPLLRPAANIQELCVSCGDLDSHRVALKVLTECGTSSTDPPLLQGLTHLHIFCQAPPDELIRLEPQFKELARSWRSTVNDIHTLTHLNLIHWRNPTGMEEDASDDTASRIQLRDAMQEASPDLVIQITRCSNTSGGIAAVSFELIRPPWSERGEYEVLDQENTWATKLRPIYCVS